MDYHVLNDLQILWDYMHIHQTPCRADCIVGFGCYDEDIPLRAAELYHAGYAPWIVFTGGLGRNTSSIWNGTEAERFASVAVKAGVPESVILSEDRSTNSAENFIFTKALLEKHNIPSRRILAVHKPYMERRLHAAAPVYWPKAEFIITSPQVSIAWHIHKAEQSGMTEKGVIETVVGDIQRMSLYAQKGYQIPQDIPDQVQIAYHRLIEAGYTGQLVKT